MRKALKRQSLFVLFCIYGGGKKVKVFDTFRFRNADASFQFGLTFRFADYTFPYHTKYNGIFYALKYY